MVHIYLSGDSYIFCRNYVWWLCSKAQLLSLFYRQKQIWDTLGHALIAQFTYYCHSIPN
jgi:hypothetical protein